MQATATLAGADSATAVRTGVHGGRVNWTPAPCHLGE